MTKLRLNNEDFITVPEVARLIGKPKMTLYRWIKANRVLSTMFGGIIFIPATEVKRLNRKLDGL